MAAATAECLRTGFRSILLICERINRFGLEHVSYLADSVL